jgi:hypothetical protein
MQIEPCGLEKATPRDSLKNSRSLDRLAEDLRLPLSSSRRMRTCQGRAEEVVLSGLAKHWRDALTNAAPLGCAHTARIDTYDS